MTSHERVVRAIRFERPDRVPVWNINKDELEGDVLRYDMRLYRDVSDDFHSCGNFAPIINKMHEIGVDVINIAQPNVVDIEAVGRSLKGKQCFLVPVSYQTTSISGTHEEIYANADMMYRTLGTDEGGFIGYVEEYGCMGMTEENYRACREAFARLHQRLI